MDIDTMVEAWEEACGQNQDRTERIQIYMKLLEEWNAEPDNTGH